MSNDGDKIYVSDEYGPYVHRLDRRTGVRTRARALPEIFGGERRATTGDEEIADNSSGRVAGIEGLALSPTARHWQVSCKAR